MTQYLQYVNYEVGDGGDSTGGDPPGQKRFKKCISQLHCVAFMWILVHTH